MTKNKGLRSLVKQDLIANGDFKPLVEEEKLEEEISAKDWKQMGANKPLFDPGEAAEVKVEVIVNKPLVDPGETVEVKVEEIRVAKGKEENFANRPLVDPGEAAEYKVEEFASKGKGIVVVSTQVKMLPRAWMRSR